jgi:hypothetical protein
MQNSSLEARIEVAIEQIRQLRVDVNEVKNKLDANYVTKDEFDPIKKLVYGVVSIVLVGVMGALLALVINR